MSGDSRQRSPTITASSSSSSHHPHRPGGRDDLTWLDFLRTTSSTAPIDHRATPPPLIRSDSADRKRRFTGTESERRHYPYSPYNARSSELVSGTPFGSPAQLGGGRATAIDLTTPPPPSLANFSRMSLPGNTVIHTGKPSTDIVLPRWQPDGEVRQCPVCHTEFSIWFRRHHCRKCGRVVCASCSPHRITIPRQYIVQPPPSSYEDEAYLNDTPSPGRAQPDVGGGEVVRVCNPCVPDPWTPASFGDPAAPAPVPPPPPPSHRTVRSHLQGTGRGHHVHRDPRSREEAEHERSGRYERVSQSIRSRHRSNTHQPTPATHSPYAASTLNSVGAPPGQDSSPLRISQRYTNRYSQSSNSYETHEGAPTPTMVPTATSAPSSQPRREVREEDECPVCGTEMPPLESVREAHIQECIASRFSSTPTQPSLPAPIPADSRVPPPSVANASAFGGSVPPVPEASRPRASSHRPRGMILYRATEKDCNTEDGEVQECVICFEEFQSGDEMGRMECLCKFHRVCIRRWWDTKGAGSCPTHQLHE